MKTTTINVFETDKKKFTELYGKPARAAFRVLIESECPHPEKKRKYTTVMIPAPDAEAIMDPQAAPNAKVFSGFLCTECNRHIVLPDDLREVISE